MKSMRFNMAINLVRTLVTTLLPLLIFKYVTNVLTPESIGAINYSNSICQYFIIAAELGISKYAIRECARVRDSKEQTKQLASELFSINIVSTALVYVVLIVTLCFFREIGNYRELILIQASTIIFITVGMEWITTVYEDYLFITLRTIAFQVLYLLLTILLVNDKGDYMLFVMITAGITIITNIANYLHSRKYVQIRFSFSKNTLTHLKPIWYIFFMNIAISIYVSSSTTILGFLAGDLEVGIYSVATKIYSAIKTILVAVVSVSIPRLSYNYKNDKMDYIKNLQMLINLFVLIGLPLITGMLCVPELVIEVLSSNAYYESVPAVRILSIAAAFSIFSTIINNNILLAQRKEKYILYSTCAAGIISIIVNFALIPQYGFIAAAMATLVAEIVVLVISVIQSMDTLRNLKLKLILKDTLKVSLGCVYMLICYIGFRNHFSSSILMYATYIICSLIGFLVIEYVMKHSLLAFHFRKK